MAHYRSMFDAKYIGSWDLPAGKDVVVTIAKVAGEELNNGRTKNKKPVISFVGKEKTFVANKTNCKAIAGMYGTMTEAWIGKKIALYVTKTHDPGGGGEIDCIRVRPTVPKGKAAAEPAPETAATGGATVSARIAACTTAAELDALAETLDEDDVGIYFDAVAKRKVELSEGVL